MVHVDVECNAAGDARIFRHGDDGLVGEDSWQEDADTGIGIRHNGSVSEGDVG